MQTSELNVEARAKTGTTINKQLRRAGMIPATIYGPEIEPLSLSINSREFLKALSAHRGNHLFQFKSEDKDLNGRLALLQERQIEPLKGEILHIDFLTIKEGRELRADVPISVIGEPACVKQNLATVNQIVFTVLVSCKPKDIPEELVVDTSDMEPGDNFKAGQLALPEGVTLLSAPEQTVVTAVINRRMDLGESETEEGEEGAEEGEEGEATEGGEEKAAEEGSDSEKG